MEVETAYLPHIKPPMIYTFIICEQSHTYRPGLHYRVKAYDQNPKNDVSIINYGSLKDCNQTFDEIKEPLIGWGNYIQEIGTDSSRILIPRQMVVNFTPYQVWKHLDHNLKAQATVNKVYRKLSAYRAKHRDPHCDV